MRFALLLALALPCMGQFGGMFPGPGTAHTTGGGGSPISLLTHTSAPENGTNSLTTSAIDTTGASLIVVVVAARQTASGSPLTDSKGNTWTALTTWGGSFQYITAFYSNPTSVGAGHTFTYSQSFSRPLMLVAAFSNTKTSTPFDVENGTTTGNCFPTCQPGSITPTQNNELVLSTFVEGAGSTSPAVNSGMTITDYEPAANFYGAALAYVVQTSASAINPTWSSLAGGTNDSGIASFKAP